MSLESQLAKAKNDLRAAKTRFITGWVIFGVGFLGIFASAAAIDSGAGGGAFLIIFIALAISLSGIAYSGDNGAAAQNKVDRIENAIEEMNVGSNLHSKGGLTNLQQVQKIYSRHGDARVIDVKQEIAREKEKLLDYDGAITAFKELGLNEDAKRVRLKMREEGKVKVDQTVVHGDYVDDRDTIIKDSVVSKSNIGAGGDDKFAKLKELKEMLSEDLIDKEEFKEMKKEIMGK
jgi:hypothetical protein